MDYNNMMNWGCGWGSGHLFGIGPIVWLIMAIAVVAGILLTARSRIKNAGKPSEDSALAILKERYARGEIDQAEFNARKRDLI